MFGISSTNELTKNEHVNSETFRAENSTSALTEGQKATRPSRRVGTGATIDGYISRMQIEDTKPSQIHLITSMQMKL